MRHLLIPYTIDLTVFLGGLIALGLFKIDWSLEDGIKEFKKLSKLAFKPREALRVPKMKNIAQIFCAFRYKSSGIEVALQKAFGSGYLFGQRKNAVADRVRVGVVAAMKEDSRPHIFANYSRKRTAGMYMM